MGHVTALGLALSWALAGCGSSTGLAEDYADAGGGRADGGGGRGGGGESAAGPVRLFSDCGESTWTSDDPSAPELHVIGIYAPEIRIVDVYLARTGLPRSICRPIPVRSGTSPLLAVPS